jgi:hypothetical protein
MKPLLPLIAPLIAGAALSACSSGGTRDACAAVPGEKIAEAIGSELVRQEKDGARDTGSEVMSACAYDFANGDGVRIVLFQYDAETAAQMIDEDEPNTELTQALGYPVFHSGDESRYEARPEPTKRFTLMLLNTPTEVEIDRTYDDGRAAVATFKPGRVLDKDAKAVAIARLIRF